MNALEPTFARIESHEFSGLVNVANNLKTFLRALADEPAFQELARAMVSPEARAAVMARVQMLAKAEAAADYEHPSDAALAAYLSVLGDADRSLTAAAAAEVAGCPGCWWAEKVAEWVLSDRTPDSRPGDAANGAGAGSRSTNGQGPQVAGQTADV